MILGVISDTHDRLPTFRRAIALFQRLNVDAIFHAGDFIAPFAGKLMAPSALSIPTYCVYGNNDGERTGLKAALPNVQDGPLRVQLHSRTIVMHHFVDWLKPEATADADLVITGHTHEAGVENRNGAVYLNPGECCGWVTDRCTVATVDLNDLKTQIIEIHP